MLKKWFLFAITSLLVPVLISARSLDDVRNENPFGNTPGKYKTAVNAEAIKEYKASSSEQKNFLAMCDKILAVFSGHPLVKKPAGYNAYGTISIPKIEYSDTIPGVKGYPLTASCVVSVRELADNGKGKPVENNSGASAGVYLNRLNMVFFGCIVFTSGFGSDIYYQPKKTGEFHGYPVYHDFDKAAVINLSKKPFWIPVSADEYIGILIRRLEDERDKTLSDLKGAVAPKEIYDEGKAERKKAFDEAYKTLKKIDPAQAEIAKKEFEKSEKEFAKEASGHKESSDDVRAVNRKMFDDQIASLKRELSGLTAAQKKAQAVVTEDNEERLSGLGDASAEYGKPIVRINKDYFNDGLPKNAVRCAAISFGIHGASDVPADFNTDQEDNTLQEFVIFELYNTADWKEIFSILGR